VDGRPRVDCWLGCFRQPQSLITECHTPSCSIESRRQWQWCPGDKAEYIG